MRLLVLLFIPLSFYGQYFDSVSIEKKINFVTYLKANNQTEDALHLLHYFNSQVKIDSLQLFEAKLLLELRREKDADTLLQKCAGLFPDSSNLNCSYILLKNHANLLIGNYDKIIEPKYYKKLVHYEAWRIQLLSATLLNKKMDDFDLVFNAGKCNDANLALIEFYIYVQKVEISRRRKKSSFIAGLLSAIIPGSGKIYAGKPHEALTGFIPVAFNLAQAGEGYYYKKFDSPHLYIFGLLGTVFYASGIYGSGKAATRKNNEFNTKIKNNIEYEITKLIKHY